MVSRLLLVRSVLFTPFLVHLALADCYKPDGTPQNNTIYQRCSDATQNSACCALAGRPDIGQDTCLPSGLCQYNKMIWREGCTDPTWKSPFCVNLCPKQMDDNGNTPLTLCEDGKYCCGGPDDQISKDCCASHAGYVYDPQVANFEQTRQSSTISSAVSSATPKSSINLNPSSTVSLAEITSSPSASATGSPSSTPAPAKSSSKAPIIGGVVGGVAVVAILAGILLFLRRRQHNQPTIPGRPGALAEVEGSLQKTPHSELYGTHEEYRPPNTSELPTPYHNINEHDGVGRVAELPGHPAR